jgi:hypothetical protein
MALVYLQTAESRELAEDMIKFAIETVKNEERGA